MKVLHALEVCTSTNRRRASIHTTSCRIHYAPARVHRLSDTLRVARVHHLSGKLRHRASVLHLRWMNSTLAGHAQPRGHTAPFDGQPLLRGYAQSVTTLYSVRHDLVFITKIYT
ncbi:hypothetical protein HanIR_Chr15g0775081 [Helianthus annuus]|nr:hypothetical protein HanIR_Chr15g0775081 [Helianthus annuus]